MIKVGKYTFIDWEKVNFNNYIYHRRQYISSGWMYIAIELHHNFSLNEWMFYFCSKEITKLFNLIYGDNICNRFLSLDEAKEYIDTTLIKLSGLKAFL